MQRLLARLERRFGRFAIEHLTWVLTGGMAIVFALLFVRPEFMFKLVLNLEAVKRGEVWRLVTYLFIPPTMSPWFVLFALYIFWMMGTNLENQWGAFKFNVFYFVGMIGTTVAAVFLGGATNVYLNLTIFFAFATMFPRHEFLLFFILPVQVRWLALLAAGYLVYQAVDGGWAVRGAILAATANYFLFFGGYLWGLTRGVELQMKQAARRSSFAASSSDVRATGARTCAICGASENDGADIRVCSCEKCGGKPRTLCLEHARNH